VSGWIANARMYSVTPAVEALWQELLRHVAEEAGVTLDYVAYPAPRPLEQLWSRTDLGAVFMCGFPVALGMAPVVPIAAPIPDAGWAGGRALYRSDLIVRADAPYRHLQDTFGGRAGFTVAHSHSGFNAFRHHLLPHRSPQRPRLYASMSGDLITARRILDGVREGSLDIGPLDAYWHLLIARHAPQLTQGIRVLESTPCAPIPCFVAAADAPAGQVQRLRAAFVAAHERPWFAPLGNELLLQGFAPAASEDYSMLLEWDREAKAAGYAQPA
jgi:ABC-type phosphate/phosphonate transport system substrate-binding protein